MGIDYSANTVYGFALDAADMYAIKELWFEGHPDYEEDDYEGDYEALDHVIYDQHNGLLSFAFTGYDGEGEFAVGIKRLSSRISIRDSSYGKFKEAKGFVEPTVEELQAIGQFAKDIGKKDWELKLLTGMEIS